MSDSRLNLLYSASSIEKQTFKLKTLTPLFMHGWLADVSKPGKRQQKIAQYAEMRAPSIKGIWRYWWRALQFDVPSAKLFEEERRLFGGVGGEEGIRSPIILRVRFPLRFETREPIVPHKRGPIVASIPQNETVEIEIATQKKRRNNLSFYSNLLKFTLALAGFGQRARRGAGSLQLETFCWDSVAAMQVEVRQLLQSLDLASDFQFPNPGPGLLMKTRAKTYSGHPTLQHVWVGKPFNTAEGARTMISEAGHEANPGNRIQYLGSSGGGEKRLASPLLCTVRQIGEQYHPVILEVSSRYFGKQDYEKARDHFLCHLGVEL